IRQTSYPSCNLNFSNLGKLYLQRLYATKPPCIEIGWRIATEHWKKGYATEGAKAALDYAFNILNKDKVVSFTATVNKPSQAVMERLGMRKVKYFNHPKLPDEHALQKHVLYEIYHPKLEL
ncbi:GNAT family N-acetyltransferase, partial [Acinetobacter baumannii]|uniref:GNAT family N-acetyltransferase n=1 Tax=Acinetobacter baumannii TaxID=470 RepID=UPI001CB6C1BE